MTTDWLVYRCETCHQTIYVNVLLADTWQPPCGHAVTLQDTIGESAFCTMLDRTRQ